MDFRSDYERQLASLKGAEYQELLRDLQGRHPLFRRYDSWDAVIMEMRRGTSRDAIKDDVLRPILAAHSKDQDSRWRSVLLVIFWPALVAIHARRTAWDLDPGELWQRLFWCFHQTICHLDVRVRSHGLPQKIYNDTFHRLHADYARDWDRSAQEAPVEEWSDPGVDISALDDKIDAEEQVRRMRSFVDRGQLTETDFRLVVGTLVYGFSLEEAAERLDLGYEAAKKRRQRTLAKLRLSS